MELFTLQWIDIYGDRYTTAPKALDPVTKDPTTMKALAFVEDIGSEVVTSCDNGQGSTYSKNMHLIAPRFRARQEVTGLESSLSRKLSREQLLNMPANLGLYPEVLSG